MVDEPGVRLGFSYAALLVLVAALVAGHVPSSLSLLLVATLLLVAAPRLPLAAAVLLGFSCWAFWTGFAEHGYGTLTLAAHDVLRLGALLALAAAASSTGRTQR